MTDKKIILERYGFVQAMNGMESWCNIQGGEILKFKFLDRSLQKKLYCKHVKITIETIDENEIISTKTTT